MVRKLLLKGLLALAVLMIVSFVASSADAKVRQCMIGGVPHFTAGEDGQQIDEVSWVEKGRVVTLTWATPARKAVVVKKVRLPKVNTSAPKKIQKKATQQQPAPSNLAPAARPPAPVPSVQPKVMDNGKDGQVMPLPVPVLQEDRKPVLAKVSSDAATPADSQKSALGGAEVRKPEGKLTDWEVRLAAYRVDEKGRRKLIREYLRSPAECYDRRAPDYSEKPAKGFAFAEDRYDRHTYVKTPERPVKPGTVVHFALTPKPDNLALNHIVRDINNEKMEVLNVETGQFVSVEKPQALQLAYPTEYHKFYKEVRVSPLGQPAVFAEMYENMEKGSG